MTVPSIRNPNFQAIDSSGNPLEGGKLYVFEPGQITTAKTSYTDSELTAGQENTHPIILDSKGECELYYSGTARLRLFTSDDVLVDDWDNVGSSGDINTEWVSSLTPTFSSSTSFTLSGDQTSVYHTNRRIRATDSTTLYGYISSSSFSAPNTTVNVTLDSGSLSASLSEVSVGIISATNTSLPSNSISAAINSATAKTTPVDADTVGLVDSAASNVLKKLSWANIKATLKTYFDSVTTTLANKTLTSPTINDPSIGPSDSGLLATLGNTGLADYYLRFRNDNAGNSIDSGMSAGLNGGTGGYLIWCGINKNFGIVVDGAGTNFETATDADLDFEIQEDGTVLIPTADINSGAIDDTTIGASSPAAGTFSQVTVDNITLDAGILSISAALPEIRMIESDASANNRAWITLPLTESLHYRVYNDALSSGTTYMSVDRTGITVDTVNLQATNVQANGVNVSTNSTSSTHTCQQIELGHASDTTLTRSSAGVIAVEGVTVPLNSTTSTHTAQQIELGHASDTTLTRVSAGQFAVEGVTVATSSNTLTLTNKTLTSPTINGGNINADIIRIEDTGPQIFFTQSGASTDNDKWNIHVLGEQLAIRLISSDALSATDVMTIDRTEMTVDTVAFPNGAITVGSPTGGAQGAGTINAKGVYDDGVILTDYVPDAALDGDIDVEKYDALAPNRTHGPARRFKENMDELDPAAYANKWKQSRKLPAFTRGPEKKSLGESIQALIETCEVQAAHIDRLEKRISLLENP